MSAIDSSKPISMETTTPLAQAFMISARKIAEELQKLELTKDQEYKREDEELKSKLAVLSGQEERITQESCTLEQKKKELADAQAKLDHDRKTFETNMAEREKRFEQLKEDFDSMQRRANAMLEDNDSVVEIDVGGHPKKFKTFCKTLCRFPDSTLAQLMNAKPVNQAIIFIDRDGQHFDAILNYLRSEHDEQAMQIITRYPLDAIPDILEEAKYYNLRQLVKLLNWARIRRNKDSDMTLFEKEGDNGYVTKEEVDLTERNFTGFRFEKVHFKHGTSFQGSVLERAVFSKCKFEAVVSFIDTDLRKAQFVDCDVIAPIIVTGANMKGARLPDHNVQQDD